MIFFFFLLFDKCRIEEEEGDHWNDPRVHQSRRLRWGARVDMTFEKSISPLSALLSFLGQVPAPPALQQHRQLKLKLYWLNVMRLSSFVNDENISCFQLGSNRNSSSAPLFLQFLLLQTRSHRINNKFLIGTKGVVKHYARSSPASMSKKKKKKKKKKKRRVPSSSSITSPIRDSHGNKRLVVAVVAPTVQERVILKSGRPTVP